MAANNEHRGGFEHSDVNVIAVGKAGILLLLATMVSMLLIVGVFKALQAMEGGQPATVNPASVFPLPQLRANEPADLKLHQEAETSKLTSYGWVDASKGVTRVPISQAMDLLVQKGVPVRTALTPDAHATSQPTESSLGSKMQQPGGPLGEGK